MALHDRFARIVATETVRTSGLIVAGILLATPFAALAQDSMSYRGNQEDQQACTDDVFRLCNAYVPDQPRIVACLIENKRNLSPACKVVFSRRPDAAPSARTKKASRQAP